MMVKDVEKRELLVDSHKKLKIELLYDPTIPFLGTYLKKQTNKKH